MRTLLTLFLAALGTVTAAFVLGWNPNVAILPMIAALFLLRYWIGMAKTAGVAVAGVMALLMIGPYSG